MKYDGRGLIAPGQREVVAIWDYTSKQGYLGEDRWLCKTADGQLYLYWCLTHGDKQPGDWMHTNSGCWPDLAANYPPVWSYSDTKFNPVLAGKCVCDLHQLMRGDGHDTSCPEKPVT